MPSASNQSLGASPFTPLAATCKRLTFTPYCRLAPACVILRERRVRARPASDSDPVRRHGPERGSTGEGGRPRSFFSGPPPFGGAPAGFGRTVGKADRSLLTPQAASERPAAFRSCVPGPSTFGLAWKREPH